MSNLQTNLYKQESVGGALAMKPDFRQLTALVDIAYKLGYFEWAERMELEIARLREVFQDVKASN